MGDIIVQGKPTYIGWMTLPMSPMSWNNGSQPTPTDSGV